MILPGPKGRPLVGNAVDFERDPVGWLRRTNSTFGDLARLDSDTIVIYHPDDIHQVLAETNRAFVIDKAIRTERAAERERAARSREWHLRAPHVRKCLGRGTVSEHLGRVATSLSTQLSALSGTDLDVFTAAQRLCGRAVIDFFLGADGDAALLTDAAALTSSLLLSWNEHPEARRVLAPLRRGRRIQHAHDRLLGLVNDHVRRRQRRGPDDVPLDVLDELLAYEIVHEPDEAVTAIIEGNIVAGFSVPGAALSWLLVRLARHPEMAERIGAEGLDWQDGKHPRGPLPMTFMPYTAATVSEVLRLHPPHWLMGRLAVREVTIGGYRIAPGQSVLFAPYLVHRDPRWWPDPEVFRPERWLTAGAPHAPHAYLPFGAGPRTCPGAILGTVELVLLAAELTRSYRLCLPGAETVTEGHASLLVPDSLRGGWSRA